jgi:hypothetical protein
METDMNEVYKTFSELDVQPGDVVESVAGSLNTIKTMTTDTVIDTYDIEWSKRNPIWRIVSRASRDNTPKLWRDMTPEEKGALLLHEYDNGNKSIQYSIPHHTHDKSWGDKMTHEPFNDAWAYRVRAEPKRETVTLHGSVTDEVWGRGTTEYDTHRIAFDMIDGKPDCDSIKMEPI